MVKLQIAAGKATPAPPVGTALGPHGVNIMDFCKNFNAKTNKDEGLRFQAAGQADVRPLGDGASVFDQAFRLPGRRAPGRRGGGRGGRRPARSRQQRAGPLSRPGPDVTAAGHHRVAAQPRRRRDQPGVRGTAQPGGCGSGAGRPGHRGRGRPTLPQLGLQYHGRWGVSRPSSGWDRVLRPRDGHRATGPDPVVVVGAIGIGCGACVRVCARRPACRARGGRRRRRRSVFVSSGGGGWLVARRLGPGCSWSELFRAIRTARLRASLRFHLRPINVLVWHGPRGDLVWRGVSRLDAFSGYPVRAWLPSDATGVTTGAPEARPSRSSRTGDGASQVSCTHGR